MGCAAGKEELANHPVELHDDANNNHNNNPDQLNNPHNIALQRHLESLEGKRSQTLEAFWIAASVDNNAAPPHYVPSRGPMSIHQKVPSHAANLRKRVLTSLVASPLVPAAAALSIAAATAHPISYAAPPPITNGNLVTAASSQAFPMSSTTTMVSSSGGGGGTPRTLIQSPMHPNDGASDGTTLQLLGSRLEGTPQRLPATTSALSAALGHSGRRLLRPASAAAAAHIQTGPLFDVSANGGGGVGPDDAVLMMHTAGGAGGEVAVVVGFFPIPRWFPQEQSIPSSEKVLLEAAEGKLSLYHTDSSNHSSVGGQPHHHHNNNRASSSSNNHRPPLSGGGGAVSKLDLNALASANGGGGGGPGSGAAAIGQVEGLHMRSHYVLPDDVIVARAMLIEPLQNYSVGWIKIPVAPVTFKQTTTSDNGNHVGVIVVENHNNHIINVEGLDNNNNVQGTTMVLSAESTPRPGGSGASPPRALGVGFLSPDKPIYNTATDGPVRAPYQHPDDATNTRDPSNNRHQHQQVSLLPRYLEKYFLYVKHVTAVCVTLGWRNATDLDTAFVDVGNGHTIVTHPTTATTTVSNSSRPPAGVVDSVVGGNKFFMALPVTNHFVSSSPSGDDRQHHCIPSLDSTMLLGETSVPLYLNTPITFLFPEWGNDLMTYHNNSGGHDTAGVVQRNRDRVERGVALLSHDEICWIAFRLKFLEWLKATTSSIANAHEQGPRTEPLLSSRQRLQAVHLALRVGVKFQYDNTEFIAFNEHGRSNYVRGGAAATLSSSHQDEALSPYLTFVDKSRSPAVQTSNSVAESPTVVMSLRLASSSSPTAADAPAQPLPLQQQPFLSAIESEVAALKTLFQQFLPRTVIY